MEYMKESILHIKNMVCPRCISNVKDELENLNLEVVEIKLGEVKINGELAEEKMIHIKNTLEKAGFELIEDKNRQIVLKIKVSIIDLIHYKRESLIKVNYSDYLSEKLSLEYKYISSIFSAYENITIEKFMILQKIERAKELIEYNELSLTEIANEMGYSSTSHLSNQFKRITGLSPSQYVKLKEFKRKSLDNVI